MRTSAVILMVLSLGACTSTAPTNDTPVPGSAVGHASRVKLDPHRPQPQLTTRSYMRTANVQRRGR